MRFWDTSALVPLCVEEPRTETTSSFMRSDRAVIVWWGTRVELRSALARRGRESPSGLRDGRASARAESLAGRWTEVLPSERLRSTAERLLDTHPLRSQDALPLAAALMWSGDEAGGGRGRSFVCLDERLRHAAAREGFEVLPPFPTPAPASAPPGE